MIQSFINLLSARLSVLLLILTMLMYLFRIGSEKKWFKDKNGKSFHERMKKPHIILGGLLIILSLLHGILSHALFTLNWGSLSILFIILLGISYVRYDEAKAEKWRLPHGMLGILATISLIVHLVIVL